MSTEIKFPIGTLAASQGVNIQMEGDPDFKKFAFGCVDRHMRGQWGKVPPEDAEMNERALQDGARIMSVYDIPGRSEQADLWIITEADRSVTTILFPNEY